MSRRLVLVTLLAGGLIAGCGGDDPTGPAPAPQPQPGELMVTVSSTAGSVGAVILHVTGPGITDPTAAGGASLYHHLSGNTLRAAAVGTSLSGAVLRFSVPDVRQHSGYAVTVQQAAGNDNEPLAAGGVSAEVSLAP